MRLVFLALFLGAVFLIVKAVADPAADDQPTPPVTTNEHSRDGGRQAEGPEQQRRWEWAMRYDSYLAAMVADGDSMLARWPELQRPLRVFLPSVEQSGVDADRVRRVREAFYRWTNIGHNSIPVTFRFVRDSVGAEIIVAWVDRLEAGRAGQADYTRNGNGWIQAGRLSLVRRGPQGVPYPPEVVYTVALHEIGHLLGLGHSDDRNDVMYPSMGIQELSTRDRTTARLLYQFQPGRLELGS